MVAEKTTQKKDTGAVRAERLRSGPRFIPSVDIVEQDDRLLIVADLPGVQANDVQVQYQRGLLHIHGRVTPRQEPETAEYLLREYGVGDFYRPFEVGEGIDADRIEAELHNGVLALHLPKVRELRPRRVTVKSK